MGFIIISLWNLISAARGFNLFSFTIPFLTSSEADRLLEITYTIYRINTNHIEIVFKDCNEQ